MMSLGVQVQIEDLRLQYTELESETKNLNDFLNKQGIKRVFEYKEENDRHSKMWDELDHLYERINNVLKSEAVRLGYIPAKWLE